MKSGRLSNETVRAENGISSTRSPFQKSILREKCEDHILRVAVQGCGYLVDFGPGSEVRFHRVSKDKQCSCGDAYCQAIEAVREYLRNGGLRAPDRPGIPACPICGAATYHDRKWDGRYTREPGWRCEKGGLRHFLMAKTDRIQQQLIDNPWLFPPLPGYPGLRRSELISAEECRLISTRTYLETGYDPTR